MESYRIGFRQRVTAPFLGQYMQKLRAFEVAHVSQREDELRQVVAIDGTDVVPTQLFKERARRDHTLHVFFGAFDEIPGGLHLLQHALAAFTHGDVGFAGPHLGEIAGQSTRVVTDGHLVVVEDHQHIGAHIAGMRQCFKGHTAGNRAIADHGHDPPALLFARGGEGHAHGGGDAGRGMPHAKGVVLALAALGEAREPSRLTHGVHAPHTPGQYFVRVGLMTDIPDQAVVRGVEDMVQGDRQFHHAEPGAEVPAGAAHAVQEILAQFPSEPQQFFPIECAEVAPGVNAVEQGGVRALNGQFVEHTESVAQIVSLRRLPGLRYLHKLQGLAEQLLAQEHADANISLAA